MVAEPPVPPALGQGRYRLGIRAGVAFRHADGSKSFWSTVIAALLLPRRQLPPPFPLTQCSRPSILSRNHRRPSACRSPHPQLRVLGHRGRTGRGAGADRLRPARLPRRRPARQGGGRGARARAGGADRDGPLPAAAPRAHQSRPRRSARKAIISTCRSRWPCSLRWRCCRPRTRRIAALGELSLDGTLDPVAACRPPRSPPPAWASA